MGTPVSAETILRLSKEALFQPNVRGVARVVPPGGVATVKEHRHPYPLVLPDPNGPFHFSHHIGKLCADISKRMPDFAHIDMNQVLVTFVRCRNNRLWGLQAKLVPLRFQGGDRTQKRRGYCYQVQRFYVEEVEVRYVLSFYLPRFLNQSFDEKMITIFHELYHIDPQFTGDIRRFGKDRTVHDRSQRDYDIKMAQYAREYLARKPDPILVDFLRVPFAELRRRFGEVVGVHIPSPKLIPIAKAT